MSAATVCINCVLGALQVVKQIVLLGNMDLRQQLLLLGFQGGISRLEKFVCFLESQDVGRIEDLIGMACISRS